MGCAVSWDHYNLWREDTSKKGRVYVGTSIEWRPSREAWCGVVIAADRPIAPQPDALIATCCPACVSALQHFLTVPNDPQAQLRALAPDLASGWTASRDGAGLVKLAWDGEGYSTTPHSDLANAVREAHQIIAAQDDPAAQEWAIGDGEDEMPDEDEEPQNDESPDDEAPDDKVELPENGPGGNGSTTTTPQHENLAMPPEPLKREARWGNKRAGDRQHWFAPTERGWQSACVQVTTDQPLLDCSQQPRCARCEAALERVPTKPDPAIPAPTGFRWEQHDERWRLAHPNGYHTNDYHDPQRAIQQAERWLLSQPQPHTPTPEDFPAGSTFWDDGWRLIRDLDTRHWSVRHTSGLATEPSTKRGTALKAFPALDAARRQLAGWQITFDTASVGWCEPWRIHAHRADDCGIG